VRRATIRVPVPEPGESGVAALVGTAGFAVASVAYLYGRHRGECYGWFRGHDQGVETGRDVERRWPSVGLP
jgi:hypothetical protein